MLNVQLITETHTLTSYIHKQSLKKSFLNGKKALFSKFFELLAFYMAKEWLESLL